MEDKKVPVVQGTVTIVETKNEKGEVIRRDASVEVPRIVATVESFI